jgi:fucose permease
MGEFLPFLFGCAFGAASTRLQGRIGQASVIVICLGGGAVASAVNGELSGNLWTLFVTFDSLQVWVGVAVTAAIRRLWKRLPTAA